MKEKDKNSKRDNAYYCWGFHRLLDRQYLIFYFYFWKNWLPKKKKVCQVIFTRTSQSVNITSICTNNKLNLLSLNLFQLSITIKIEITQSIEQIEGWKQRASNSIDSSSIKWDNWWKQVKRQTVETYLASTHALFSQSIWIMPLISLAWP